MRSVALVVCHKYTTQPSHSPEQGADNGVNMVTSPTPPTYTQVCFYNHWRVPSELHITSGDQNGFGDSMPGLPRGL
ncbi:hypothetical protein RRG08_036274 [Elysia crispata]|uniref:Uncharacterized protein n=1 Tax=Elysia crispata TaxID=231223 RepID=A0AAE0ZSX8_9GAST|nr:hypothetical protein RRG08_036274 [Elysia crispata]